MIKPLRNMLRRRGWILSKDLARISKESCEAKIGNWRKERALKRIADKAYTEWTLSGLEPYRELHDMAQNALNLKGSDR